MPKDPLESAKAALAGAERKFPGSMARAAGVTRRPAATTPTVTAPPMVGAARPDVQAAADFAKKQGIGGGAVGTIGVMHEGGKVPKTGNYLLEEGETVIPADKTSQGRQSEYRKVYIARRQSRSGGGNAPVKESAEKHDQKKAEKTGQPSAKEAGAHVKD